MIKFLHIPLILTFILGCQADPSAHKLPKPSKVFVDKSVKDTYNPAVDILFIIDDSGSMGTFQQRLARNSGLFIEKFFNAKFIDYHIGVTTSDVSGMGYGKDGKLESFSGKKFVTRDMDDGEEVLGELFNVGVTGAAVEKFLSVPQMTFSKQYLKTHNKGFYRDDAHLVIFVITDTEDQSNVSPEEAYKFLVDLKKGDERKVHYAGAIVTIEKERCEGESDQPVPLKLRKMINSFQSRGYIFNICKSNYGEDLARVATAVVESVSTIYLDNLPDVSTLKVSYGGKPLANDASGWTYDFSLNAIRLSPNIDLAVGGDKKLDIKYEEVYTPEEI